MQGTADCNRDRLYKESLEKFGKCDQEMRFKFGIKYVRKSKSSKKLKGKIPGEIAVARAESGRITQSVIAFVFSQRHQIHVSSCSCCGMMACSLQS